MSKRVIVKYSNSELNKLLEDKTSCISVVNTIFYLQLFPYHLADISGSIKDLLKDKITTYCRRLDGILLGYKNLTLLTPHGAIVADSCYIHVSIEGDFFVFQPKIQSTLTGVVNKISKNHVNCLVHKVFNISVPIPKKTQNEDWIRFAVDVGQEVKLLVTDMELDARLPYIRASLISCSPIIQDNNEIDFHDNDDALHNENEESPNKKGKKKNKVIKDKKSVLDENETEDIELNYNDEAIQNEDEVSPNKKGKKHKKKDGFVKDKKLPKNELLDNSVFGENETEDFDYNDNGDALQNKNEESPNKKGKKNKKKDVFVRDKKSPKKELLDNPVFGENETEDFDFNDNGDALQNKNEESPNKKGKKNKKKDVFVRDKKSPKKELLANSVFGENETEDFDFNDNGDALQNKNEESPNKKGKKNKKKDVFVRDKKSPKKELLANSVFGENETEDFDYNDNGDALQNENEESPNKKGKKNKKKDVFVRDEKSPKKELLDKPVFGENETEDFETPKERKRKHSKLDLCEKNQEEVAADSLADFTTPVVKKERNSKRISDVQDPDDSHKKVTEKLNDLYDTIINKMNKHSSKEIQREITPELEPEHDGKKKKKRNSTKMKTVVNAIIKKKNTQQEVGCELESQPDGVLKKKKDTNKIKNVVDAIVRKKNKVYSKELETENLSAVVEALMNEQRKQLFSDHDPEAETNKSKKKTKSADKNISKENHLEPEVETDKDKSKQKRKSTDNPPKENHPELEVDTNKGKSKQKRKSTDKNISKENHPESEVETHEDKSKPKKRNSDKHNKNTSDAEENKLNLIIAQTPKLMANDEDRRTKKRRSSTHKQIIWDKNESLNLYDPDLEKMLKREKKEPVDDSDFNLVKITALNEDEIVPKSNKRKNRSLSECDEPVTKKAKRKSK